MIKLPKIGQVYCNRSLIITDDIYFVMVVETVGQTLRPNYGPIKPIRVCQIYDSASIGDSFEFRVTWEGLTWDHILIP